MNQLPLLLAVLLATTAATAAELEAYSRTVASLISPKQLATLGKRGANPRLQKAVAYMAEARTETLDVDAVLDDALGRVDMTGKAAALTREGLLRNLKIADELGVLDSAGLADMKRGQSPTIQRGPYKGQELTVDHVVPLTVAPEVGNVIANLELLPAKLNSAKRDKVGERQLDHARKLREAGLLSAEGLQSVEKAR